MHDTLSYLQRDPIHRVHHHNEITFSILYAWSENYVLPISHDEVVHGKGSLVNKFPGDRWQQLATLRLSLDICGRILERNCSSWEVNLPKVMSGLKALVLQWYLTQ